MGDQKNPEVWKAVAMQDHFEKIQKLKDKIDGVPNFRRYARYPQVLRLINLSISPELSRSKLASKWLHGACLF